VYISANEPTGSRDATKTRAFVAPTDTDFLRTVHRLFRDAASGEQLGADSSGLLRELREQVHPRGRRDIRLAKYVDGLELLVDVGDRLGSDVYYGSYSEIADLILLQRVCPERGAVIDVGANYGFFSVLVAHHPGFQGRLVAIEPVAEAATVLSQNLASVPDGRVAIRRECLGALDEEIDFHVAEETAFSGISDTGRSKIRRVERLQQRRLDSLLQELGISSVDILKIDVEGHESDVLSGGTATIARSPDVIVLVEISEKNLDAGRRSSLSNSISNLQDQGFRAWQLERRRQPIDLVEVRNPERGESRANNVFFVRAGSTAEGRLLSEFQKLRDSADGQSYLNGNVQREPAPTADLLALAERLSVAALVNREREHADLENQHARVKAECARLQEECASLRSGLEAWQAIAQRSLWHRIARLLGYKS
jgi:FkbM family methyltransferase